MSIIVPNLKLNVYKKNAATGGDPIHLTIGRPVGVTIGGQSDVNRLVECAGI